MWKVLGCDLLLSTRIGIDCMGSKDFRFRERVHNFLMDLIWMNTREAQRPHLALCGFLNCTSALRWATSQAVGWTNSGSGRRYHQTPNPSRRHVSRTNRLSLTKAISSDKPNVLVRLICLVAPTNPITRSGDPPLKSFDFYATAFNFGKMGKDGGRH